MNDKASFRNPDLRTKTESINIRLSEYTVAQLDGYVKTLNMSRGAVIETFLMIFMKYSAMERLERSKQKTA